MKLHNNDSTGYKWEYEVSDETIIKIETNYEDEREEKVERCSGFDVHKITPLKEGKTTITFIFSHLNEDEPSYDATYEITVDKNFNISETHSGTYFDEFF